MAVGIRDIQMVRALMSWKRELNRSLQDDLDCLDDRRDTFVHQALSRPTYVGPAPAAKTTVCAIDRFQAWLSEERRRLVRVAELRCEECWRKAVTARDSKGMTPLHWAAVGAPLRDGGLAVQNVWRDRLFTSFAPWDYVPRAPRKGTLTSFAFNAPLPARGITFNCSPLARYSPSQLNRSLMVHAFTVVRDAAFRSEQER